MRKQGQRKTSHGLLILQDKMRWGCNSYLIFTRKSPKYQLRHLTVESATVRWRILITHFGEKICWRWLWGKIRENYVIKDVICSENHNKICNQITFLAKTGVKNRFSRKPTLFKKKRVKSYSITYELDTTGSQKWNILHKWKFVKLKPSANYIIFVHFQKVKSKNWK